MVREATLLVAAASAFLTLAAVFTNLSADEAAGQRWQDAIAKPAVLLMASRAGF